MVDLARRLRAATALGGLGCSLVGVGPAMAADAASTGVQELVVTGSRLPRADLVANSPIVTLDAEGLAASASLTLETALNRLPQVTPSFSSAANNPSANGAAYVNLRGLGANRNLVLLDGRRTIGANASNSVDLNTIPEGLIDRVEVITGGASAVYGADAVAGVVNVILKSRFEGLEARGRTLVSERGDGREHEASLTAGRQVAGVSLMASVGWARREEVGKGARDFSSQAPGASSFLPSGGYIPSPANLPTSAAVNTVFGRYGVAPGLVSTRGGVGGFSFNTDGTLFSTGQTDSPFDAQNYRGSTTDVVTGLYPDVYAYNYQPFNKLILPLERWSGALFARARPSDRLELYAQVRGIRYTASTALAPTPAPTDPNPLYPGQAVLAFTIPVTNPFIPADLAQLLASRRGDTPSLKGAGPTEEFAYKFRAVALGPRQSDNTAKSIQALGGARLDLAADWRADAFVSYGRYERAETQSGLLNVRRFEQLLDSPTGGKDLCDGGFNPFGATLTTSCRDFLNVRAHFATTVEQTNAVASLAGTLGRLPAGPVLAVAGAEFRDVRYAFAPPAGYAPGEISGFIPLTAVSGSIRFAELFAEAAAPLMADRPLVRALDLTLGYRHSQERRTGGVDSWKAELGWTPVAPLKLRAAVQRAVRAPDIFERYQPPVGGSLNGRDPCASDSGLQNPQVLALCRRQAVALGFPASITDDFEQGGPDVSVLQGGNPDLKPERATTFTVGAVWRPAWDSAWIGRLAATVDGYDIRVKDAIGYQDPQVALNACYNIGGVGNPTYDPANPACQVLTRSASDFGLFAVGARETNEVSLHTAGVDASLAFRTDLAQVGGHAWLGRLDTRLEGSWLGRFRVQASSAQRRIDYAGTIAGSDGYRSLPRWKADGSTTWTSGPAALTLTGRYIDGMENRARRIDPTDTTSTGAGAAWYWDLSGRWEVNRRAQLRAGIANLFDRGPELFKPAVDAGTDPSTYDVIGRRFWVGLTLRL
ncbi:MAG: TonB-dependent receptor [Caulobacterales bacterium]|nr:TonB-dependent receptor [Caulobacterales bacterium]